MENVRRPSSTLSVDIGSCQGMEPISPMSSLSSDVVSSNSSDNDPLTPQEAGMSTSLMSEITPIGASTCHGAGGATEINGIGSSWQPLDAEYLNWITDDARLSTQYAREAPHENPVRMFGPFDIDYNAILNPVAVDNLFAGAEPFSDLQSSIASPYGNEIDLNRRHFTHH